METLLLLKELGSVGGMELVETIPESRVIDCAEGIGLLKVSVIMVLPEIAASQSARSVKMVNALAEDTPPKRRVAVPVTKAKDLSEFSFIGLLPR